MNSGAKEAARFTTKEEAAVAISYLQSFGVKAALMDSYSHDMRFGLFTGGFRVFVPASQELHAKDLLENLRDVRAGDEPE